MSEYLAEYHVEGVTEVADGGLSHQEGTVHARVVADNDKKAIQQARKMIQDRGHYNKWAATQIGAQATLRIELTSLFEQRVVPLETLCMERDSMYEEFKERE